MNFDDVASIEDLNNWLLEYQKTQEKETREQIRNLIVFSSMSLVKKIAHGLARRSTDPIEDLIQVGSVGLLKAIDQFDFKLKTSFKTYATYLITGEIRHYLRDKCGMIRAPRELHELSARVSSIINHLTLKLGRTPTDLEIAEHLEINVNRVSEVCEVNRRKQVVSLDQVTAGSQNECSLIEKLIDDKYQDYLVSREDRIMLNDAIQELDSKLQDVILMSFFEDMNQSEIAKTLKISQMQVSRRLKKALSELFKIITARKKIKS